MNDQQQSRADALTDEHIATLKLAARAVTPQDIDGAERIESRPDGSYITCPACEGEGCIPFESDYCNYDHVAIGVQFYGVGTEPGAAEAYFRAAKPATILALLDRLERAESALAAPPVEQPAAAPADERASGMPDEVRDSMMDSQYLAGVTAGWNAANADDPNAALKKIHDAYSGYLNPLRDWQKAGRPGAPATPAMADERAECIAWANANGFPKYHESMCAAWEERARRAAASPAAEEDPYNTWWKETLKYGHANGPWSATNVNRYRAIPDGWMLVPKHHGTKPLAELIIAASLACVENRLMEDDDRHELAQFADQLQSMSSEATVTTTRPRWTRNEIDGLLDDADRLSRHPGKAAGTIFDCACVIRELLDAPQPAQPPNYCDIHCKKFCQNSVHGMCDGPPAQQPSDECPHGIDDGACKECYHAATDTERLDWVMHRLSGKALRDIGVVYCEGNPAETRANIDAAIDQRVEFSEKQLSGEVTPLKVERHSDMSVLVVFSSCRQASVFEREIAARAQGGES